jgi:hypothetical protein
VSRSVARFCFCFRGVVVVSFASLAFVDAFLATVLCRTPGFVFLVFATDADECVAALGPPYI